MVGTNAKVRTVVIQNVATRFAVHVAALDVVIQSVATRCVQFAVYRCVVDPDEMAGLRDEARKVPLNGARVFHGVRLTLDVVQNAAGVREAPDASLVAVPAPV